ncbi:hypothetical protein TeGR_g10307, partial [Tetraparma gracilis]
MDLDCTPSLARLASLSALGVAPSPPSLTALCATANKILQSSSAAAALASDARDGGGLFERLVGERLRGRGVDAGVAECLAGALEGVAMGGRRAGLGEPGRGEPGRGEPGRGSPGGGVGAEDVELGDLDFGGSEEEEEASPPSGPQLSPTSLRSNQAVFLARHAAPQREDSLGSAGSDTGVLGRVGRGAPPDPPPGRHRRRLEQSRLAHPASRRPFLEAPGALQREYSATSDFSDIPEDLSAGSIEEEIPAAMTASSTHVPAHEPARGPPPGGSVTGSAGAAEPPPLRRPAPSSRSPSSRPPPP